MSELKAINAHGVRKDDGSYYDRRQVDKYIDELDERHTTEITALEVSYKLQLDGLRYDKDAEIRRLKRALWLARANSAEGQFFYWCARFGVESGFTKADIRGYSVNTKRRLRTIGEWIEYWKNVKSKCLKKAEEYK